MRTLGTMYEPIKGSLETLLKLKFSAFSKLPQIKGEKTFLVHNLYYSKYEFMCIKIKKLKLVF